MTLRQTCYSTYPPDKTSGPLIQRKRRNITKPIEDGTTEEIANISDHPEHVATENRDKTQAFIGQLFQRRNSADYIHLTSECAAKSESDGGSSASAVLR